MLILLVATSAFNLGWTQAQSNFRTWKIEDGMEESNSIDVSVGPEGNVWVRHGDAPNLSSFDGREFTTIPVPSETTPVSIRGTQLFEIREFPSGVLWGSRSNGIYQYQNEAWHRYALPPDIGKKYTYSPIDEKRVLFLTPDRLVEFNIETEATRLVKLASDTALKKFSELKFDRHSGYWITGSEGIAKITFSPENSDGHWEEFRDLGNTYKYYKNPIPGWHDDIFVMANNTRTKIPTLMHFDGMTWKEIYYEGGLEWGWIDPNGGLWVIVGLVPYYFESIEDRDYVDSNNYITIELLGSVNDVETCKNGEFWIATDQGLVSYFPSLWRTPPGIETGYVYTQSICESSDGTIWFSFPGYLSSFFKGKWTKHPLPKGYTTFVEGYSGLSLLPDGRIGFGVNSPKAEGYPYGLMTLDPASGVFELEKTPGNMPLMSINPISDGSNIVSISSSSTGSMTRYSLNSFDGAAFHTIAEARDWKIGELRASLVARNGAIWLGGDNGLGIYSDGEYQKITKKDGFTETGGFAIHELDNGDIWVGGRKRIVAFDGKKWRTIKEIGAPVRAMMTAKNGDIWVSTDVGLYRYAQGSWFQHTEEDGLPSSTVWFTFEDTQGRIWSATEYGPSQYYPDTDMDAPETRIPSDLNSQIVPEAEPLNLIFEGADKWEYTPPDHLLFSYRINEGEWSAYSSNNTLQVEDLTSGFHQVEVRAIDQNLNVDPTPAHFSFKVLPTPIQERAWFIPSLIALTTLMTFLVLAVSTARKKLAITVNSLEETVQIRTAELREDIEKREISEEKRKKLEQQLLQAQKMESIGTLAGGIAHDFNNILQAILGYTKMAQGNKNGNAEKQDRYLQEIEKGGLRAAALVEQILTFSRKTEVKTENLILPLLIEEALKFIRSSMPSTIHIESDIDPDCPQVVASSTQIHQVVTNLCTNAMHAMEGGGGTLSVVLKTMSLESPIETLSGQLEAGDYIQLSISDTGVGIDPDVMNEILDPFFTTKGVGKGTGLGLSMTHGIVSAMGGGLTIKSEVGKGTTVLVTLPVAMERKVDELSIIQPELVLGGEGHIMLVDDEEPITQLATHILEDHGFTVDVFNDVESAIETARDNSTKYDLAVLDYTMPSMTGIDLAKEFETLIPGMPVLIATGLLDNSDLEQSKSRNIAEIIHKPYSSIELLSAISRELAR